jgi:hypothetical protein
LPRRSKTRTTPSRSTSEASRASAGGEQPVHRVVGPPRGPRRVEVARRGAPEQPEPEAARLAPRHRVVRRLDERRQPPDQQLALGPLRPRLEQLGRLVRDRQSAPVEAAPEGEIHGLDRGLAGPLVARLDREAATEPVEAREHQALEGVRLGLVARSGLDQRLEQPLEDHDGVLDLALDEEALAERPQRPEPPPGLGAAGRDRP